MARGFTDAPRSRPSPLSLLNSAPTPAAGVGDDGQRWVLGWKIAPDACSGGWVEDPCAPGTRTVDDRPPTVEGEPFDVVAGDRCSAFGFNGEDYEGRARRLLDAETSYQVARELWKGTLAQASGWPNNYLAHTDSDVLTDGPTAVIAALACLEQGLAQCGRNRRGMIHATPQVVTHWAALGPSVLRREGGMLLTVHDTIVVTDGGYDGSGPSGQAAGASQWAYGTSLIEVRLGPVSILPGTFAEAFDRADNTVEYFASRPATYLFDECCHVAVELDVETCAIGGVS